MPDPRDRVLFRWGEELRRLRCQRRTNRRAIAAAAGAAALATATMATLIWPARTLFVWNMSASSPTGLYLVWPDRDPGAGGMAAAWAPTEARRLASERGYIPANVPLVKNVAASAGDRVCAVGEAIFVNGRLAALRSPSDGNGRPLPSWTGCADLAPGELLLLTPDNGAAFDGRYFGITAPADVIGEARLIWRG